MDLLTADISTYRDPKERQYDLDRNGAATRMNPPTASMSTDTRNLRHVFDNCERRVLNHPGNVGMPQQYPGPPAPFAQRKPMPYPPPPKPEAYGMPNSTEAWPYLFQHEGRSMDPTTAGMPIKSEEQPFLHNIEKRPHLPNVEAWQDLPSEKAELNKLVLWLNSHDGEWLADALWLRYAKVAKVIYSNYSFLMEQQRQVSKGQIRGTECLPEEDPPMPYNILPAMQLCEGIDRLSALPHDLRVEILSYLLLPNLKMRCRCWEIADNTLKSLALVSRSWRDQVDAFCGHALLAWKQKVARGEAWKYHFDHGEPDSWVEWRALKSYTSCARMEYVFRTRTCCVLCGGNGSCLVLSTDLAMIWCAQCRSQELNLQDSDDDVVRYR